MLDNTTFWKILIIVMIFMFCGAAVIDLRSSHKMAKERAWNDTRIDYIHKSIEDQKEANDKLAGEINKLKELLPPIKEPLSHLTVNNEFEAAKKKLQDAWPILRNADGKIYKIEDGENYKINFTKHTYNHASDGRNFYYYLVEICWVAEPLKERHPVAIFEIEDTIDSYLKYKTKVKDLTILDPELFRDFLYGPTEKEEK